MELPSVVTSILAIALLFLGPLFLLISAMTFIMKRYKRHHTSPLTRDLLRPAGHTLQEQIDDQRIDLFGLMLMTPLMLLMGRPAGIVTKHPQRHSGITKPASHFRGNSSRRL